MKLSSYYLHIIINIAFFGFFVSSVSSQRYTATTDSLKAKLKTDPPDTNKVIHLNQVAYDLIYVKPDTSVIFAGDALELATELINSNEVKKNLTYKNRLQKLIVKSYSILGLSYWLQSEYALALDNYFEALRIRNELNDKKGMAASCTNIGVVYYDMGDFSTALEYFNKASKMNEELKDTIQYAICLVNVGTTYAELGKHYEALACYQKILDLKVRHGLGPITLGNIGEIYEKQGDSSIAKGNRDYAFNDRYPKALEYYFKALEKDADETEIKMKATWCGDIGGIYLKLKKYKLAESYLLKAFEFSSAVHEMKLQMSHTKELSEVYAATNRFNLAYTYHTMYTDFKDSVFNGDKSKEIGRLEAHHEIEMIQKERERAEEENLRKQMIKKNRRYLLQYSGIFVILLILGLMVTILGFKKVSPMVARGVSFFSFLLLFEFLLVLLDPYIDRISRGEPAYKLFFNAGVAALIFPIHAFFERVLKNRLVK